jgi:hypothetical protein
MRLAALLLEVAGGLIALLSVALVFVIVADRSVYPQLGISTLIAVAVIVLGGLAYRSSQTRIAGILMVLLSGVALLLGLFSEVFRLPPVLFGMVLSLAGGILTLLR